MCAIVLLTSQARSNRDETASTAASPLSRETQPTLLCLSASMFPRWLLLCALLLLCSCCSLWCSPVCVGHCCRFVEDFPNRLRRLRENYQYIQDFYVS